MPASLHARMTRTAISPRLAMSTFCNGVVGGTSAGYRPAAPAPCGESHLTSSAVEVLASGCVDNLLVAVLGTGPVGRAIAGRLSELGHTVTVGTRDPDGTAARDDY